MHRHSTHFRVGAWVEVGRGGAEPVAAARQLGHCGSLVKWELAAAELQLGSYPDRHFSASFLPPISRCPSRSTGREGGRREEGGPRKGVADETDSEQVPTCPGMEGPRTRVWSEAMEEGDGGRVQLVTEKGGWGLCVLCLERRRRRQWRLGRGGLMRMRSGRLSGASTK
eukprot:3080489-Rhodomonas_salina.2